MFTFQITPPTSLYIHLPWCIKKCPYCDFNSHTTHDGQFPEQAYIDALIRDLEFIKPELGQRQISSIFIGGGTPSLFSAQAMKTLLTAIECRLELTNDIEITLEANPGAVDVERFKAFRECGFNRISIGIQSFNNAMLKRLGRVHDGAAAFNAIGVAQSAGFNEINLDLMYGLPQQRADEAMDDLMQATAYDPVHLSWYQLTIEPNTVFYKQTPTLPSDDDIWDIQEQGKKLLTSAGYQNYEISAYAKPGHQCKHNLNYWNFGDYIGIGAGAHSNITDVNKGQLVRYVRHRLPERYIELAGKNSVITETKILNKEDVILEFMMNVLRLTEGFSTSLFEHRSGLKYDYIHAAVVAAERQGWLQTNDTHIRPTILGQNYLNDVLQYFMPETDSKSWGKQFEYA
jgi:putative oxygen-independent coproporphyrinogen III oxidase